MRAALGFTNTPRPSGVSVMMPSAALVMTALRLRARRRTFSTSAWVAKPMNADSSVSRTAKRQSPSG